MRTPKRRTRGWALLISAALLAVVALVVVGCGGSTTTSTAATTATTSGGTETTAAGGGGGGSAVSISNFAFSPASITVKVGDTVTWTNQDSATHTVVADDGSFKSGDLGQGATFSFTFSKAGSFTYKCGIHPNMTGTVVVQ